MYTTLVHCTDKWTNQSMVNSNSCTLKSSECKTYLSWFHLIVRWQGVRWQPKLSIFVKLSKCAMDLTIAFLLSRWSKETYMERPIRSPWEDSSVWVLGKILSTVESSDTCRKCRQPSEIPRNLKKPARVSGVIPTLGIPTGIGSFDRRQNFELT